MNYFIDRIAQYIYDEDLPLSNLTIVLPSQRAKKYLQRALFKVYEKPIFSPEIITMNRWIQDLSPLPIIDPTRALFKLYEVHKEVDKTEQQTLDEFLNWGKTLLSDFDEMDRYLIDSKDLFKNLADIKELENWSFNTDEELTEGQKRFMRFWDLLKDYYSTFNEKLNGDSECYMGSAYKFVSQHIDLVFQEDKDRKFIFAGFNALSPAEKSIMKQLERMGRANVFIDADNYYLNDEQHEAGHFLRDLQNSLNTSSLPFVGDMLSTESKEINLINCAQPTGQAKVSATILNNSIDVKALSDTLLLLADEKMVVPVIKNIPKSVKETNITLGMPLKNTAIRSWVELIFTVQEHFQKFKTKAIYHKDFIRFIKHPFIHALSTESDEKEIKRLEQMILDKNWLFISTKHLSFSERLSTVIKLFFQEWSGKSKEEVTQEIRKLNEIIFNGLDIEKYTIEKAIVYHFDDALKRLENILNEFKPDISLGTFKSIFNQHWSDKNIAYYGNPLDGLQVMGLLETRLLDFENIIVIGLNDGSMPPTNPIQTFIPMDLRRHHNLPTPREKQGLFAHHFYRLLHHAKKVWITYSSAESSMGMDEPSRYIQQLELELARKNKKIAFHKEDYTLTNEEEKSEPLSVAKTKDLLERLSDYFETKTSTSAIKTALSCPLDFYYKYLLGFGEEGQVEEDIEASSFGNFIHDTLEELYTPFARFKKDEKGKIRNEQKPKSLSHHDVSNMLKTYSSILKEKFEAHFSLNKSAALEGKNFLSLEVADHLVKRFLTHERNLLKNSEAHLYIEGLEITLNATMNVQVHDRDQTIRFVGIIDRIDDYKGRSRIIDYKSGTCEQKDVTISNYSRNKSLSNVERLIKNIKEQKYVLQLLIYNWMYHEEFQRYPEKAGIISMVNIQDGPFYLKNELTEDLDSLMRLFKEALTEIIGDLFDDAEPIQHNIEAKFCDYCI
tara:strand:+ start:72828 stop:75683 length:2856 start_codon:yes stop_codon:yes gene_type:complete